MAVQAEFLQQTKDALVHLHDYPYLETHPLARRCWPDPPQGGPSRAQKLHRWLLEGIEALNPPARSLEGTPQHERYLLLVYRYVEGREIAEVMQELGYSRRQYFREQQRALRRLSTLLWERLPQPPPSAPADDLLAAEAEPLLTRREALALAEVVDGVLEALRPLAVQQHVDLLPELAPHLGAICGNRTVLRQILLKSLSYLIRQPGTQRIALRLRPEGRWVTVELAAEPGPLGGPTEGDLQRHEAALEAERRLVGMMGGNWQGFGAHPYGYACRLRLPTETRQLLLAIEDNEAVVRAFRRYLAGYGYEVVGVCTLGEALRLAREESPTAITLDLMMPAQDGWEVLQALKNDPATGGIPVIICSVLDDPDLARSLGAAGYLRKPVTQADLLSALADLPGTP